MSGPILTRIDHVGIACHDLDESIERYETLFGLTVASRETNEAQGVHEVMLAVASHQLAPRLASLDAHSPPGSYIQLLQPTRPDSPVGRFLDRRGEGIHHIGYGVADIRAALVQLAGQDLRLLDERPRHGSMGASIAFLHPKDLGGVLTELVQAPAG